MHRQVCAILACICLAAPGCSGDNRSEVSGTVSLNGRPIEEGSINFIPVEGNQGPGTGGIIRDGKYHIPRANGVTAGKNRVEVRAFRETGRKVQDPTGLPGALTTERVPAFPPEFNDKSTLVREVRAGSDTIDFDVHLPEPGKAAGR
ncbi:MAG: hypothetical protein JWO38_4994 [Gemmataceae bacterium]|nr:hypothetical protein [Gemmataceae bacterium]